MKSKPEKGGRVEDEVEGGIRVYDPGPSPLPAVSGASADLRNLARTGYQNTAVISSRITFIDGERGILRYRCVLRVIPRRAARELTCLQQWVPDRAAGREEHLPRELVPAPLRRAANQAAVPPVRARDPAPHLRSPLSFPSHFAILTRYSRSTATSTRSSAPSGEPHSRPPLLPQLTPARPHSYDAHPMAILTSSLAALGAFAPDANPSLQG